MLSLQLKDGEYLTIGRDIVIQVFTGATTQVLVQAPRDLTILRGEVLERNGEDRPACLLDQPPEKMKKAAKRTQVSNG
jgi:sRNA-binding carbon storage regulator CsrA